MSTPPIITKLLNLPQGLLLFIAIGVFCQGQFILGAVCSVVFVCWVTYTTVKTLRKAPGRDLVKRAKAGAPEAQVELGLIRLAQEDRYGQYKEEAVQLFHAAAKQGDAEGCYQYGLAQAEGIGSLTSDIKAAIPWWKKAADAGHAAAMSRLADCYEWGEGVKKAKAKALDLRKLAAEKGDAASLADMAWAYSTGEGVPRDREKACKLWLEAAQKGHVNAQINIGDSYAAGTGVGKDMHAAVEWWSRAAEAGDQRAQHRAGCAYALGCGVEQDLRKADKLLKQAKGVPRNYDHVSARVAKSVRAFIKDHPDELPGLAEKGFYAGRAGILQKQAAITPLMVAAGEGDLQEMRRLIAEGADVRARADEGDDALFFAVQSEDEDSVRLLLEAGAEANPTAPESMHPLPYAAECPEILRMLLEAGADVNARTKTDGDTALHLAVIDENEESISLLMKAGADIKLQNDAGESPLSFAQEYAPHLEKLLIPAMSDEEFFK